MKKGWVFIWGAIVGGALGWVAGVLSAPRPGAETVSALSEKAIELTNRMGFYGTPVTPQPEQTEAGQEAEPAEEISLEGTEQAQAEQSESPQG